LSDFCLEFASDTAKAARPLSQMHSTKLLQKLIFFISETKSQKIAHCFWAAWMLYTRVHYLLSF